MAELKKSVTSYRRTGSSGLVWNKKHVSEFRDPNQTSDNKGGDDDDDEHQTVEPTSLRKSKSVGARASADSTGATTRFRKVNVTSPSKDPPSPKLPTCGLFCFPVFNTQRRSCSKSKKRR